MKWLIIKLSNDCVGLVAATEANAGQVLCIDAYLILITQAQYVMGEFVVAHHQIGIVGRGVKVFLVFIGNSGTVRIFFSLYIMLRK